MTRPWRIEGHWYAAGESRRVEARLEQGPLERARLYIEGERDPVEFEIRTLTVSARLGNTPRIIRFPDGAVLETADNEAVDRMLRHSGGGRGGWVHWLESRWPAVLAATFLAIVFVWGSVQFGLPAVSRHLAHQLPADTLNQVSRETLAILDRTHLKSTTLEEERQKALRSLFAPMLEKHQGQEYRVLFRRGGESMGANAMALPDGTLIFTDELIHLAKSDDELLAILAHEVGHVEHRHSLRALIQSSLLGFGAMVLLGDSSGVAEIVAGLPVIFASLSYSRAHELEADAFSADWMDRTGVPREAFVSIMTRLREWSNCRELFDAADIKVELNGEQRESASWQTRCADLRDDGAEGEASGINHYLSTHPAMEERLRRYREH